MGGGGLAADWTFPGGPSRRGSYVVKLDQPYRNYAVDLLEPQRFPAESETIPYDDVSWAFPVGFGVTAARIDDERVTAAPVRAEVTPAGRGTGDGGVFLLRHTGQE